MFKFWFNTLICSLNFFFLPCVVLPIILHSTTIHLLITISPFLIRNLEDLQHIRTALENLDMLEWARQQRPNAKWIVMEITNATFYATKLRGNPTGKRTRLPPYTLNTPALVAWDCH